MRRPQASPSRLRRGIRALNIQPSARPRVDRRPSPRRRFGVPAKFPGAPLLARATRSVPLRGVVALRKYVIALLATTVTGIGIAQIFSVDWYRIGGGGGSSTGGVLSVSGTIGQQEGSGPTTGGDYSLTGGFWGLYAIQTPGAPRLTIKLTSTNTASVSWPSLSDLWRLQQNTNLATTNWVSPAEVANGDGTNRFIIVSPPAGRRFYRLTSP